MTTCIRRVRVVTGARDAVTLGVRTSRLLSRMELRPSGLPASAVLCVRRFKDPLPGKLRLGHREERASPEWLKAAVTCLDQLFRTAARPATAPVSANAEAVLFLDRAEMLACLARDWCATDGAPRWWWRSLFPRLDLTQALRAAWLETPGAIPAAMVLLAENAKALSFLRALDRADARSFLERVAHAFALTELGGVLEAVLTATQLPGTFQKSTDRDETARSIPATRGGLGTAPPPWQMWIESDATLPLEQQCLLGVCVTLQHAPGFARSKAFAQAVRAWHELPAGWSEGFPRLDPRPAAALAAPGARENDATLASPPAGHELDVSGNEGLPRLDPRPRTKGSDATPASPSAPDRTVQSHEASERKLTSATAGFTGPIPDSPTQPGAQKESMPLELIPPAAQDVASHVDATLPPAAAESFETGLGFPSIVSFADRTPSAPAESIETGWGGVFYLITVALSLELYGDFTMPARPGLALPLWDFLALLGRRLIGGSLESDPLWRLLAQLSARAPDESPGRWFEPPGEWRVPPEWLAPFSPSGAWTWSAAHERLRVQHPQGFLVIDVPWSGEGLPETNPDGGSPPWMTDETLSHMRQSFAAVAAGGEFSELLSRIAPINPPPAPPRRGASFHAPSSSSPPGRGEGVGSCAAVLEAGPLPAPAAQPLDRWLDWLTPYVQARLALALGASGHDSLRKLVFDHHGRVEVTGEHVTIRFSLAAHPIELRLAGLDRDPGWVPAAGRTITFQYD